MSLSSHRAVILAALASAAVAFFAGRWSAPSGDETHGDGPPGLTGKNSRIAPVKPVPARETAKTGIVRNSGQQPTPELLTPALKHPNRLTRLKHVLEWAETIDENNWREALNTWMQSGISSSYGRDIEARLVLERIGAMGGGEAMTTVRATCRNGEELAFRSRYTVAGWASTHPGEAMDWFITKESVEKKSGMAFGETRGGMMEGLSQSDLTLARKLSEQVRSDYRDEHIKMIMDSMDREGNGGAAMTAWIEQARAENKSPGYANQLISTYVEREMSRAGDGDKLAALYEWATAQCTQPGASPALAGNIVQSIARQSTTQAMEWLSSLPDTVLKADNFEDTAVLFADPDIFNAAEVQTWMEAHPDHVLNGMIKRLRGEPELEEN